jgi:hypothetical protein
MTPSSEGSFDQQAMALKEWVAGVEPGDCPMCGAARGEAHRRGYCFSEAPDAGRPSPLQAALEAMPEDEAREAMRPWEPWLIDLRWVRWIIADFMGVEKESLDRQEILDWLKAHGQDKHFARCSNCGSEAVRPYRDRCETPDAA